MLNQRLGPLLTVDRSVTNLGDVDLNAQISLWVLAIADTFVRQPAMLNILQQFLQHNRAISHDAVSWLVFQYIEHFVIVVQDPV